MVKKEITDKYLLNLPIKAKVGDIVIYNSYSEGGKEMQRKVEIIDETDYMYIYSINKHKIPIGFHKSRLVKIVKSKSGQCQIFNQ